MDFPFDLSKLDLTSVMNMVRQFKERMAQLELALAAIELDSIVGGGMVAVKANARGEIKQISIDPELIEARDRAMLEHLIVAAVNQALAEARTRREEETQRLTGGLNLPGFFA